MYEKMKDVLMDAKAAAEKLARDLLKLSAKIDKSDEKSSADMCLIHIKIMFCQLETMFFMMS